MEVGFDHPVYDDPTEWMLKEGQPPDEVTAEDNKLENLEDRARFVRVFERGLGEPTGHALPIQPCQGRSAEARRWRSERWKTRRGKLCLVPGDSSAGFRLPLAALPHVPPAQYPYPFVTDPAVERGDGRLCVFLPPTQKLEDYLELVAAEEKSAKAPGLPVHVEGYDPPHDPWMNVIRVAPDPGVIEMNIHPAHSWEDCVATTEAIHEEAHLSRLGTDKFMIDGRHTGTGGGNHVAAGGATLLGSPFLRRPGLLKSLILLGRRHPSLGYLFSGLFIGPTSQAPRIDEARQDTLYELEIALSRLKPPGESEVPLTRVETSGVAAGGVRFKAWQPGEALHPTLPVNTPLVFDIYDDWTGRAIGGCTYHLAHPGGGNCETFPVNGYEAEARRLARFGP